MSQRSFSVTKDLTILYFLAVAIFLLFAWPIEQPGTMDAHYYFGGGRNLLENRAFVEPYIWNYLDDPAGLPTPSHLYWMPLPSILVAASQSFLGASFKAAQFPFILLAAGLPLLSYITSWRLSRNRRHALVAGGVTIWSGFYFPFWSLPETFAPFAIAGGLVLFFAGQWAENKQLKWLVGAGVAAGLGHLCRADGLLLLGVVLLMVLDIHLGHPRMPSLWLGLGLVLAGYLLVTTPWFIRNWHQTGNWFPTAGTKTIFLQSYDELFSFGTELSLDRYLKWGMGNIVKSKLAAGWSNIQTFVAVNNLIFLTPLALIGAWRQRQRRFIWPAVGYILALYGIMTVVFTFPGVRGGVFHSSVATLPFVFALSMEGLDGAIEWIAQRRRHWQPRIAKLVFSWGIILLAAGLSVTIYSRQIIGDGAWTDPAWNQIDDEMVELGNWLKNHDPAGPTVMVGNPPAFYYHTGLPAVVIPNERVERVLAAAERYGASYLILDRNHPQPLRTLYERKETHPALELVWDDGIGAPSAIVVYRIKVEHE